MKTHVPAQRNIQLLKYGFLEPCDKLGLGFPDVQTSPNLEQLPQGFRETILYNDVIIREERFIHLPTVGSSDPEYIS